MKVTALIPDQLVSEIDDYAKGKNLTESLVIVLKEWLALKKIEKLNKKLSLKPLQFIPSYSAEKVRQLNRKQ